MTSPFIVSIPKLKAHEHTVSAYGMVRLRTFDARLRWVSVRAKHISPSVVRLIPALRLAPRLISSQKPITIQVNMRLSN